MVFYQIKKREQPLRIGRSALVLVLALIFSFALCALLLFFGGTPPVAGIRALFTGAFGSRWALEDTVVKAIPIFLCSLGVAAAFRLRIWMEYRCGRTVCSGGYRRNLGGALFFPAAGMVAAAADDCRCYCLRRALGFYSGPVAAEDAGKRDYRYPDA